MAKALAKSLGCTFQRIQFTPDLLPSDITGITFFNQKKGDFEFRPGPLLSQVVLADEINRATIVVITRTVTDHLLDTLARPPGLHKHCPYDILNTFRRC